MGLHMKFYTDGVDSPPETPSSSRSVDANGEANGTQLDIENHSDIVDHSNNDSVDNHDSTSEVGNVTNVASARLRSLNDAIRRARSFRGSDRSRSSSQLAPAPPSPHAQTSTELPQATLSPGLQSLPPSNVRQSHSTRPPRRRLQHAEQRQPMPRARDRERHGIIDNYPDIGEQEQDLNLARALLQQIQNTPRPYIGEEHTRLTLEHRLEVAERRLGHLMVTPPWDRPRVERGEQNMHLTPERRLDSAQEQSTGSRILLAIRQRARQRNWTLEQRVLHTEESARPFRFPRRQINHRLFMAGQQQDMQDDLERPQEIPGHREITELRREARQRSERRQASSGEANERGAQLLGGQIQPAAEVHREREQRNDLSVDQGEQQQDMRLDLESPRETAEHRRERILWEAEDRLWEVQASVVLRQQRDRRNSFPHPLSSTPSMLLSPIPAIAADDTGADTASVIQPTTEPANNSAAGTGPHENGESPSTGVDELLSRPPSSPHVDAQNTVGSPRKYEGAAGSSAH